MKVHFIGAGPGDPELITLRGRRLIERCPVCLYAGSLVPREVVACAPPSATVIDTSPLTLDQIIELICQARDAGHDVARVHSGDPSLYGAIAEQIRQLDELGIAWQIVPGVSSFLAAAAELGIELTPAGANQTVILTRAPGRTGVPENENLAELAKHRCGLCLFLSAAQMPDVVASLTPHYGLDAPAVVVHRATWPDQQILRGMLGTISDQMRDAGITLTALVLVGPMLEPDRARNSRLYDPSFSHRFRKRTQRQASRVESREPESEERQAGAEESAETAPRTSAIGLRSPFLDSGSRLSTLDTTPLRSPPCLIIAGTSSGVGKTTVALGLMAALRRRGLVVQPFKVGPDFIDPGHHTAVCGRPSRNLDTWMLDDATVRELYLRGVGCTHSLGFGLTDRPADVAIIEGVMGLFDGAGPEDERGSTAHLAKVLGVPVVLVADGKAVARSLAATVRGFAEFERDVPVVGVIANRVAGPRHFDYLAPAIARHTSVRPLGFLPQSEDFAIPERHLGLHTSDTDALAGAKLDRLVQLIEQHVRVDELLALARPVNRLDSNAGVFGRGQSPHGADEHSVLSTQYSVLGTQSSMRGTRHSITPRVSPPARRVRVALARGSGFSFYYEDNLDLLRDAGAELIGFDPGRNHDLPDGVELVYLGGGYPELHAAMLSANTELHAALRRFVADGGPIYAECGGMMYLTESIEDHSGRRHAMVGLIPARVRMQRKLAALGYVRVRCDADTLLGPAGTELRGHEFHYSAMETTEPLARRTSLVRNGLARPDGISVGSGLAGYAHLHFASSPAAIARMLGGGSPVSPGGCWRAKS